MEEKDSHGGGGTPAPPAAEGKAEDVDGSRAAGCKKVVQLDLDRVLERADATDPCKVLAVDARAFSLETVEALKPCLELQAAFLSSNLLSRIDDGLLNCQRLLKLDLSQNALAMLPGKRMLERLSSLKVLYLHDNHLSSLKGVAVLSGLHELVRLTLFGNPLASHSKYRHFVVNSLVSLKALDEHVISDQELIEDATFPARFSPFAPESHLPLQELPAAPAGGKLLQKELVRTVHDELGMLNRKHARVSPVLILQSAFRMAPLRLRLLRIKQQKAVTGLQGIARSKLARLNTRNLKLGMETAKQAESSQKKDDGKSSRALNLIQSTAARRIQRIHKLNAERRRMMEIATREAAMLGNDNLFAMPYLYVPMRQITEVRMMIPELLGDKLAATVVEEVTSYYAVRESDASPESRAPRTQNLVLNRRNRISGHLGVRAAGLLRKGLARTLRMRATDEELRLLHEMSHLKVRPNKAELTAGVTAARREIRKDTEAVPIRYQRSQLVRFVMPSLSAMPKLLAGMRRRNGITIETIGEQIEARGEEAAAKQARRLLTEKEVQSARYRALLIELLLPIRQAELEPAFAATTIQRVWRGLACCKGLNPSIATRVLQTRCAVKFQRWWRRQLAAERMRMLKHMRDRVANTSSNRLYIPTTLFESLYGPHPLHAAQLWPEHKLRFSFSPAPDFALALLHDGGDFARGLPSWSAPEIPTGAAAPDVELPSQEPLSLLSVGVRQLPRNERRLFGSYVRREWTCVCFTSTAEAARRAAMVAAIAYEPLAWRTVHGKLQGQMFEQLCLFSEREVKRWEAASCIQAAWLSFVQRPELRSLMDAVRARLEMQRLRDEEARRNAPISLLNAPGNVQVDALFAPAKVNTVAAQVPRLNLEPEQISQLMNAQADELGVLGFPPTVSVAAAADEEVRAFKHQQAQQQRVSSMLARQAIAERQERDLDSARQKSISQPSALSASSVATAHALRQMQQMLAERLAMQEHFAMREAIDRASEEEEVKQRVAALRESLRKAQRERHEDREVEHAELVQSARMERRQLELASQLQRRAEEEERERLRIAQLRQKAKKKENMSTRAFSMNFAAKQNSMAKAVRLADLQKRQQEKQSSTLVKVGVAREETKLRKAAAVSRQIKRADAKRQSAYLHNVEIARAIETREQSAELELEMLRSRKQQLRELRQMLARPAGVMDGRAGAFSAGSDGLPPLSMLDGDDLSFNFHAEMTFADEFEAHGSLGGKMLTDTDDDAELDPELRQMMADTNEWGENDGYGGNGENGGDDVHGQGSSAQYEDRYGNGYAVGEEQAYAQCTQQEGAGS